jgi:hypothetical protein
MYTVTDLGLTNGTGINASGQVSGFIYPQVNLANAALWSNGTVTNLITVQDVKSTGRGRRETKDIGIPNEFPAKAGWTVA